jgi:hypothetical protein
VEIQEYLIAAIQNIEVLLRYGEKPKKTLMVKVNQVKGVIKGVTQTISGMMNDLSARETHKNISLDLVYVGFNET